MNAVGPASYQALATYAPEPLDSDDYPGWPCEHCANVLDDHLDVRGEPYCVRQIHGGIPAAATYSPDPGYDPEAAAVEDEMERRWEQVTGR